MATFAYVARMPDGRVQRGVEEAATAAAIVASIRGRGGAVIDVRLQSIEGAPFSEFLQLLRPSGWLPARSLDIENSLLQAAVMLRAGVTLLSALSNVSDQALRASVQTIWRSISQRVQQGSSLADAAKSQRAIPPLVVQLIRIGEQTGNLEAVLRRSAHMMERRRRLRQMLVTALLYPVIVLVAAVGVAAFMIVWVIPKLERFLLQLGRKLPPLTQSLLDLSAAVRTYWIEGLVGIALTVSFAYFLYSTTAGRFWIDRVLLRTPVIGALFRLSGTALVSRAMSILLESGVTLLETLRTVETLPGNAYLRFALGRAREEVIQGRSLADALRTPHAFLPMLASMAAVGETAGTLDEVLDETARFHEERLQSAIQRFSALIEPAIVVVVGAVVGYVYAAFFLALFSVAGPINMGR